MTTRDRDWEERWGERDRDRDRSGRWGYADGACAVLEAFEEGVTPGVINEWVDGDLMEWTNRSVPTFASPPLIPTLAKLKKRRSKNPAQPHFRVYVSAGGVREDAIHAARLLVDAGFSPFCPQVYRVDPANKNPYATWVDLGLPWLAAAHAVLLLPGESRTADLEVDAARRLSIPVFDTLGRLTEHFGARI